MEIKITTFTNPFSFFCIPVDYGNKIVPEEAPPLLNNIHIVSNKVEVSVNHGQYVAVMWKSKWTRGVVSRESQFLIWLVDYGFYIRPNDKNVYINLPSEHKKYPTKVFEASIHGVTPVDKALTDDCLIQNQITSTWNNGAIEKAKSLIASATKIYFEPVAVMHTKYNDIVIGDLYLDINQKGIVNLVEELVLWPVFLEQNKKAYIEFLSKSYITYRKHRACMLKPVFVDANLPTMTVHVTLDEYNTICASVPRFKLPIECSALSEDGSTVVVVEGKTKKNKKAYKLTPDEIEKYSCMYVKVCGREYNVLHVLLNKIRDLNICERYKDLKSLGRACSSSFKFSTNTNH